MSQSYKLSILSFLFFPLFLFGQGGAPLGGGARGLTMANTGLGFQDVHSTFTNQAGLAYVPAISAFAGAERRFELDEIQVYSFGVAYPINGFTFGLSTSLFGFSSYNETKIGLAAAKQLFDKLAIGVQLDFLNTQIKEYGSKALFTFEIGVQSEILDNLTLAAHLYNPVRQTAIDDEYFPTTFAFGGAYRPSGKALVMLEFEKTLEYPVRVKGGIEYQIAEPLFIRLGVASEPAIFSSGVGLALPSGLGLDLGFQFHTVLGLSPAVSVVYNGKKE